MKGKFGWYCSAKKTGTCSFSIPAEVAHKKLTDSNVKDLLSIGKTKMIKGFKSKAGKSFDARLQIKDGKVEFLFDEPKTVEMKKEYRCPICGGLIVADKWAWKCENNDFSLSYKIAGKDITEKNLEELIKTGKTSKISGFVSKTGKRFSASLELKDGKTSFNFG